MPLGYKTAMFKITFVKRFSILLALGFGATELHAAAVTAEANDDNGFSAASGGDLPINNVVRVGTFDVPDSTISQNSTNPIFLNQHFIEFGKARIGTNGGPGQFSQTLENPNSNAQGFANKQIYLWVFNSTDTSDQNFLGTAFEQGVFYLDMTTLVAQNFSATAWRFRDNNEIPNDTVVDLTDLTTADPATLAPGARIVIGQFPFGISSSTGAPDFGLVQIPEPSSAGVLVACAFGVMMRRRRSH